MKSEIISDAWPLLVQSILQPGFTLEIAYKWNIHHSRDELERPIELIFAPTGNETSHTGSITELEVKLIIAGGIARRVDIGMVEVDVPVHIEDCQIVAESRVAHLGMLQDPCYSVLLMVLSFRVVEAAGIVFSNSDFKQVGLSDGLEFVSCCKNFSNRLVIVVAEVIGYKGTSADEVIVLVEQEASPGEFPRTGLSMTKARNWPIKGPCSALFEPLNR